jgi:hypothetical protein
MNASFDWSAGLRSKVPGADREVGMSQSLVCLSCPPLPSRAETADNSENGSPHTGREIEALAERISEFITRRVLEQDAQFFDG